FGFWFKKYYIRINFNSKLKKSDKCILDNLIVYKYKNKKFVKFSKKELKKIKKFIKKICKLIYKNSKFNIQIKQEYSNNLMTIDKINESISATSFDNYTCDYILFLNPLYHNLIMENYEKILIHQILHLIFLKKIKKGCKKDFINSKILFGACGEEFNLYMKKNHIFCKLNFWIS
ncbi:MAG: hypothetical protein KQA40_02630, partial [Candidatus Aenigmarchaeota archaeon]|nr:hypothetical protein [Candidatus Aenigmarchaeota archaeon]